MILSRRNVRMPAQVTTIGRTTTVSEDVSFIVFRVLRFLDLGQCAFAFRDLIGNVNRVSPSESEAQMQMRRIVPWLK